MNEIAWELIRVAIKDGKQNVMIASDLNQRGLLYKGRAYTSHDISRIAIQNGVRRKKPYKMSSGPRAVNQTTPTVADDVLEVMTSQIREPLKVKIVNFLTTQAAQT